MADLRILNRIAEGDAEAVQECLDQYGGLVWSLARRLTNTESDAEDAVQEIFVEIWRKAERYDPNIAAESTFIAMLARRRLIDRIRRLKRDPTTGLDNIDVASSTDFSHDLEVSEEASLALDQVNQLPPDQSKVILMGVYHGMSHSKIAAAIGMPLGTVKTNMRRGLLRLRETLVSAKS